MDFYSIPIPAPEPEDFDDENVIQLAQIETWNNDILDIFWFPHNRQIIVAIDDEWFAQPDTANIVTSIATLFSCDDYQIRIKNLLLDGGITTGEELWMVYTGNWFDYANQGSILQFRADVDYDADTAPQWVDIVPDSQPNMPMPDILIE
jgi:hypothetical protein